MIDLDIEDTIIKFAVYNLMMHLYQYGIEEIHLGGIMRLLGVPNDTAKKYDDTVVMLDDDFAKYIKELNETASSVGQTLH